MFVFGLYQGMWLAVRHEETGLDASRLAFFVWLEIMVSMVLHVSMSSVHLLDAINMRKQFFVGRRCKSALREACSQLPQPHFHLQPTASTDQPTGDQLTDDRERGSR